MHNEYRIYLNYIKEEGNLHPPKATPTTPPLRTKQSRIDCLPLIVGHGTLSIELSVTLSHRSANLWLCLPCTWDYHM